MKKTILTLAACALAITGIPAMANSEPEGEVPAMGYSAELSDEVTVVANSEPDGGPDLSDIIKELCKRFPAVCAT